MDLTRYIHYRGLNVNGLLIDGDNRMRGIETKRVSYPGVQGVGYIEKKALADGYDASDIYLGRRLVQMAGAVYGTSRAEFFDTVQYLVEAFTPTAAYAAAPGDKGYLPLDFYVPTADTGTWSTGIIHKMVLARPLRQPSLSWIDDRSGGLDETPLSVTWDVDLDCRDPRVYLYTPTDIAISGTASSGSGNFTNRGDYAAPLGFILNIAAGSPAGSFHFVGGGTDMTIAILADAAAQIIRVDSAQHIATLEVNGIETLRMDLPSFAGQNTYPVIQPGTSGYTWDLTTADLATGGILRYFEAWA